MNNIKDYIIEKFKLSSKNITSKYNYHPKNREEFMDLIEKLLKERGNDADLNDIDTSKITDMSYLFTFGRKNFNGDISKWNTSNVKNMKWMFIDSKFNGDISNWDVSNVKDMEDMFENCPLEKNPPKWYKK